jgi:hypothetical protein
MARPSLSASCSILEAVLTQQQVAIWSPSPPELADVPCRDLHYEQSDAVSEGLTFFKSLAQRIELATSPPWHLPQERNGLVKGLRFLAHTVADQV